MTFREKDPDERFKKYGMTRAQFDKMFEDQDYRCAICRTDDCGPQGWTIDHDHTCCKPRHRGEWRKSCGACVRAILCQNCNLLLGHAHDDPAVLEAALTYLRKYGRL